jgi:MFS superfamily sulfate permease-like transporter
MAIAIASGASPERGLYTAIVGGLIISLIGGSRFQIGGPAGAFIGLVAGVVERHGYDGLALATIVAGLILIAIGLLRAGTYIKYIPFPVTVGFTAGIAVIIAASQIRDLLGLFSLEKLQAVLPDAVAIALLGAIESLLSAVVADGMTGRRHRSNCELSAQGVANITSVLFGGICVTGTVARTATNVRAGARGPVSGIFHCVYLLIFLLIGAPLVGYIPLAALGAVLAVVAWNMAEKEEFWSLLRGSRGDAVVLPVDLSTYDFRRPRHRHRRWRCTGRAAVPASNGGSGRSRRRSNNA